MRAPCKDCGGTDGEIQPRSGQNCVFCAGCGRFAYNAPRVETGEAKRTVTSIHEAVRPKQRARILERATGRCELCGNTEMLHVGHLLSVDDGLAAGLTEVEINADANLAAMCEVCNLGLGKRSVPLRLAVALVQRRDG